MQLDLTSLNEELEDKNRQIAELERKLKAASDLAAQTPYKSCKSIKNTLDSIDLITQVVYLFLYPSGISHL